MGRRNAASAVVLVAVTLACTAEPVQLSVGVVTDWVPGAEFSEVRTTIVSDALVERRSVHAGEPFAPSARRVADFDL